MTDTPPEFEELVRARYAAMSTAERFAILASMRQTAIAIIESSLPAHLSREERRYTVAKRLYGDELPEAALIAHAQYRPPTGAIRPLEAA